MKHMNKKRLKIFWEEQRQKEREQVRPLAEKIAKAIVKCSETIKQEESVNKEIDKLRSNFYFQLEREGIDVRPIRSRHERTDN